MAIHNTETSEVRYAGQVVAIREFNNGARYEEFAVVFDGESAFEVCTYADAHPLSLRAEIDATAEALRGYAAWKRERDMAGARRRAESPDVWDVRVGCTVEAKRAAKYKSGNAWAKVEAGETGRVLEVVTYRRFPREDATRANTTLVLRMSDGRLARLSLTAARLVNITHDGWTTLASEAATWDRGLPVAR